MVAYGYLQTKHIHRIWKEAVHRTAWLVCLANPSLKFIYFASYFLVFCVIYLFLTVFRISHLCFTIGHLTWSLTSHLTWQKELDSVNLC